MDIFKCGECNDVFINKKDLNLHRLSTHIANLVKVPCPHCNVYYDDLEQHMQATHGATGPVCPYCAAVGKRSWALKLHIEQVHLNIQIHKPASCPICKKIFVKKGHMERHIKMVHEGIREGSEPCRYCGKELCNKAALEKHEAMVHEGVREECPLCHKVLCDLYKHMRLVHGTYQRKAKLPRDCLDRLDDPTYNIIPKIYGAAPSRKHLDSMKPVTGLRTFKYVEQSQNVVGSLGKKTNFVGSLPALTNSSIGSSLPRANSSSDKISNSIFSFQEIINESFSGPAKKINTYSTVNDWEQEQMGNESKQMRRESVESPPLMKIKKEPIDVENDDFISVIASIFNTPPLIKLEPEEQETSEFSNIYI